MELTKTKHDATVSFFYGIKARNEPNNKGDNSNNANNSIAMSKLKIQFMRQGEELRLRVALRVGDHDLVKRKLLPKLARGETRREAVLVQLLLQSGSFPARFCKTKK